MRRRAVGNSVTVVNASDVVERSSVDNLTEVLQAKTPGLSILPGSGTVGTAAIYRLRGASSLYANNSPTIYVDGVRVSSGSQGNYDAEKDQPDQKCDTGSFVRLCLLQYGHGCRQVNQYQTP